MNGSLERSATGVMRSTIWLFAGVLVFILTYNPTFTVLDASLLRGVILAGIAASVVAGSWITWPRQLLAESFFLIGGFVVAFGTAQALAFRGGGDTFFLSLIVACLTGYIPAAYVVASCCGIRNSAVPRFLGFVAITAAIQAVFIVLDWISPTAHALFSEIVVQPDLSQTEVRSAGLSSSAGDGLSFLQCLGAMSATFMAATAKRRSRQIGWALLAALCLASITFAGRTGFVLYAVFALAMGLRVSLTGGMLRTAGIVTVTFLTIGGSVALLLPLESKINLVDNVLPHAFEFILRLLAGEGIGTASTDDLRTMLFLPSDEETLLLGSGYFFDPVLQKFNYMGSDIGYVRTVFYVGIAGSLLVYSWYVVFWVMLRRMASTSNLVGFVDALFIVFLVAHAKFPFLFLGAGIAFSFALFFSLHLDRRKCISAA